MKTTVCLLLVMLPGFLTSMDSPDRVGKIYTSRDHGGSWVVSDSGFPDDALNAWVLLRNGNILAGTESKGIWLSDDRGQHWFTRGRGLPKSFKVVSMLLDGSFVYVGTFRHGVFRSNDDGETWTLVKTGIVNSSIRSLHRHKQMLLAGTDFGLFRASNSGEAWVPVKVQHFLGEDLSQRQVNAITSINDRLYCATSAGLIQSKDDGQSWQYIYRGGAIMAVAGNEREITILDFSGVIHTSLIDDTFWLRRALLFAPPYLKLTPVSPKLLRDGWGDALRFSPASTGLPQSARFDKLLWTPFGIFAASSGNGGC